MADPFADRHARQLTPCIFLRILAQVIGPLAHQRQPLCCRYQL
ncbi:hypothetical protein ALO83_103526 [Pseudomonas cannabina pv. alisalensis]|uniref:Uncharacterized protein n=1 Tax=Pseudomonas cannabina TaxID=86840 RepID=A0A3M3S919_PSECA|nr:Unknown protein sequence [Pseudomonas syringae pv. maculicola]KPW24370.1 hypothetical protein ALO83_103526 [Pseudomonas cannabina pv. alisalensis]RMN76709.1 hypothetical protein ALQ52_104170 [Pseudomonas cannabina pv. alisalensis]RMN82204.1 hypothetical protein ALQ53_103302 [Pseudomonas cannabina]RMO05176.1 hypothetical protein ALQ51_102015 [Pseudomonas cannabina]